MMLSTHQYLNTHFLKDFFSYDYNCLDLFISSEPKWKHPCGVSTVPLKVLSAFTRQVLKEPLGYPWGSGPQNKTGGVSSFRPSAGNSDEVMVCVSLSLAGLPLKLTAAQTADSWTSFVSCPGYWPRSSWGEFCIFKSDSYLKVIN